jgi:hypothetical protein
VLPEAKRELAGADAGIVTSYCPDTLAATEVVLGVPALHLFYDLDTPATLSQLAESQAVAYIGPDGLAPFDLVPSYTGGAALTGLHDRLGAKSWRHQRDRGPHCRISGPMPPIARRPSKRCSLSPRGAGHMTVSSSVGHNTRLIFHGATMYFFGATQLHTSIRESMALPDRHST